jgi:hypothetical protein
MICNSCQKGGSLQKEGLKKEAIKMYQNCEYVDCCCRKVVDGVEIKRKVKKK